MKLKIDHNSHIPLHVQSESLLRALIKLPEYKGGKFLPNEVALSKQLGISRNTLRQAINKLVFEGLLIRKKGVGTKIADTGVNSKMKNWLSFSQEMEAKGIKVKNYEISVIMEVPPVEVLEFFMLAEPAELVKLVRLRGTEEGPFVYFESYFHPRIGLSVAEDFSKPLYDILETKYSTVAKLSREEISAMLADTFLAQKLNLNNNDPVLKRKRFVYDPGSRPVEYNVGYYRGDSFTYTVESERE